MEQVQVLLVDDHRMFREGVRSLLDKHKEVHVVGEASSGEEALTAIENAQPEVILMDINLGEMNGIETTRQITEDYPNVKVLALTMHKDGDYVIRMLKAGAKGFILKTAGREEMLSAIKAVAVGDSYFGGEVSSLLMSYIEQKERVEEEGEHSKIPLTPREVEILQHIALEFSNPEIAEKLFISVRTVDTHRRNLLEKLNLKNTAGLVKYALRMGLISDDLQAND